MAFSLKASGQFFDALYNFNKVIALAPQIKETYNEIACVYEELNNLVSAREYWEKALQYDNNFASAEINMANSYRFDDEQKAISDLVKLTEKYPSEALVWYDLAWIFYNKKDYEKALEYAEKSLELLPNSDTIRYLTGLCYLEQEKENKAKQIFLEAEFINSNNLEVKLCLADIFSRNNEFEEAEKRYRQLINADTKNFAVYNNYAEMLHRQKRL